MAAALGTFSALTQSKPLRIEGHTSNVEGPILYKQFIKVTIGETTEDGDTYVIPHQFDKVEFIQGQPLDEKGAQILFGTVTTDAGAHYADAASVITGVQSTTVQAAGSTSFVLTTSGSAINDVYNGCYLDVRFDNGDIQTVKITDYVGATKTATIDQGLARAVAATGTFYTLKGTLFTCNDVAVTPGLRWEVTGSFTK